MNSVFLPMDWNTNNFLNPYPYQLALYVIDPNNTNNRAEYKSNILEINLVD